MRKGRSSRRARSLRPLSGSAPPRSAEALSTEVEASPNVVLGVPPSETPTSRPPSGSDIPSVSARAEIDVVIPRLPPLAMAIVEQIAREEEGLPTAPPSVTGSPDDTAPSAPVLDAAKVLEAADAAQSDGAQADAAQAEVPRAEAEPTPSEVASIEPLAATEPSPKLAEEPAPDTHRSLAPQVLATDADPPSDPDDISVPPIGDLHVERFFSQGDVSRFDTETEESLTEPDKASRKSDPLVIERRARFSRYVKWAVAGAAVLCVAAIGRTAVTSSRAPLATASKQALVAEPLAQPEAKAAPAAVLPQTVAPSEEAQNAAAEPAAAEQTEPVTGDAKEEKEKARKLLEQRKIADAIEAADRSVKLDSSDGEAWLILGAAYQEKGNMVEARKAYASCVSDAKTGPKQECAKMLR